MALDTLRVKDYRSFADETAIDLRPLTLLFGYNSVGKSAAHQKALAPVMKDVPNTLAAVERCNDNKAFAAAFAALGESFSK